MTAQKPDAAPQQLGDYDALRQRVADTLEGMQAGGIPTESGLAAPELGVVVRVVSQGVLRQLQEHGIQEAGTLAIRLGQAAETDDNADLAYTVAERYREAQAMREAGADANAQAQQERMALLAGAAGETAVAIVGSVLNPEGLTPLINSGRSAIFEYGAASHKAKGAELMRGLLGQAEAAAQAQPPEARAA